MLLAIFIFAIIVGAIVTCELKISIAANEKGHKVFFLVYIYKKVCILKLNLNKTNKKITNKSIPKWFKDKRAVIKIIRKIRFKAETLRLKIILGTSESVSTALLVGVVASTIACSIKYLNIQIYSNGYCVEVVPIFSQKKVLSITFRCIISQKLIHIINIVYKNVKDWRQKKNGRKSSNRRAYGNCNG